MEKFTPLPSIEHLRSMLELDSSSPTWLRWTPGAHHQFRGKVAGYHKEGEWGRIRISGKYYGTHRIVWALQNNEDPGSSVVDHINRKPHDNNPENLRAVTRGVNRYNSSFDKNATGYRGVTKIKDSERWIAEIKKRRGNQLFRMFQISQSSASGILNSMRAVLWIYPGAGLTH